MSRFKYIYHSLLVLLFLIGGTAELMAQFPSNIGILPAGKTITICYEVSVNANTPANVTEVCEQGSITYDDPNMPGQTLSFKTDDPSVNLVAEDPTCTNVQVCDISQATCPADITVDNDAGLCGANVVLPDPSIPTECTSATFSYSPASGSFFPIGTTQVTATISDGLGNQSVCTLNVTVNDAENPTIICPADIVVDNDAGQCGASVNIPASTINDNCPGSTFSYTPASGSFFAIGTTAVDAIVTDASGNQAMCSFNVTVNDTENPTIICPADIIVDNDAGQCGATVSFPDPTINDNCPGSTFSYAPTSGSFFAIGTTVVDATVMDASGNQAMCSFNVTVNDSENPTIICPADIVVDNDAGQCGAVVNMPNPTINDNCPGSSFNYFPVSGSFFPVGTTSVDATVIDAAGNQAQCSFDVTVNNTEGPQNCRCDITGLDYDPNFPIPGVCREDLVDPSVASPGTFKACFCIEGISPATAPADQSGYKVIIDGQQKPVLEIGWKDDGNGFQYLFICVGEVPLGISGGTLFVELESGCTWTRHNFVDSPTCMPSAPPCDITNFTLRSNNPTPCNGDGTHDLKLKVFGVGLPASPADAKAVIDNIEYPIVSWVKKPNGTVNVRIDNISTSANLPNVFIQAEVGCTWYIQDMYTKPNCNTRIAGGDFGAPLIYPNPSNGTFTINGKGLSKASYRVVNAMGQVVRRGTIENFKDELVELGRFEEGLYIISIHQGEGVRTARLILQY